MPESAVATPPSAPSTPAPSAPPSATPAPPSTGEPMNDAFSDLDTMLAEAEPQKSEKAQEKPPEVKDESPKPEAKPETEFDHKKAPPKQLREAYEKTKAELAQIKAERDELKKQSSQPKDDPEKKEFYERAERYSKRAQELENELKFAKYEKSEEYQEKYYKPYEQAFASARAKAAAIKVMDAEGNPRQGTPEDFDTYMFIQDDEAAADFAEKVFGKHKSSMEYHREQVRSLQSRSQAAVEEYRKKGSEREQQWKENQSKAEKAAAELWQNLNKTALEKYPALFKAADDDTKGTELLTKGFSLADRAFTNGQPLKDGDKPLNPAELLQLRSAMRNKFAAFDFQVHLKRKAESRVKELEAELEQYKKSEPKGGDGGPKTTQEKSWEQELESIAV